MAASEKGLVIGPRVPRVPRGLAPAVEGLAREILRHRPQDIYTFAAHHFEQLIELRKTGRASVNVSNTFDRASSNRKRRVLVDWIGLDNKFQPVSDGGSNHDRYSLSDRKGHDSVEKTREAITATTGTLTATSAKLLTRRRRRRKVGGVEAVAATAANRNGWSINETVKVFKKHAYENNANKEKSRNAQKSKKSIGKEIHSYQEQRSQRLSKTIMHCRFHRSWSVEDMHLAKNTSRRFKENQVEPKRNWGSIELGVTRKPENDASTRSKSSHSVENIANTPVRCLNRQKSVGQIEDVCSFSSRGNRDRVEYYIAVPRRTHSLMNVTSNGNYGRGSSEKEETDDISNEILQSRQGRRESLRGKGIEGKERKKSEEWDYRGTVTDTGVENDRENLAAKLNARLESDGTGSKDNGRAGDTFEYEFWCDSKGIDIDDDTNVIIDEPKFILREDTTDLASKQEDSLNNQESVILPSVIKKQCSNSRYSENVPERSENDTNCLILPPIVGDALKPIKNEDNLVLPVLSKLSEVVEIDRQPLKSSGDDRVACIEDGRERMELDASVSESQTLQASDRDYRGALTKAVHQTARSCDETTDANGYETAQSTCKTTVVDRATENDEGSGVNVETYALEENGSSVTLDSIERPRTPVKTSNRTSAEKDEERESEKEKEQEDGVSSSSAEEIGSSTTMIGDEQKRREERRKTKKQKMYPVGNDELKSKLIEIETVERNIENTLISSETVLVAEDDRESVASRPIGCTPNSESGSDSEKSSILFGNNLEATNIDGETLQEEHARDTKEDSLRNGSSKSDETDTGPRKASNASTVVSSSVEDDDATARVDAVDGEQSERHQLSINFSKDVDLSCYVLTEGSPCEIPESVTTVIIPDKRETVERETIDDTSRTRGTIEQGTGNPFGEYIVHPAETFRYSTNNCHMDFLCDIKDTVDRSLAYKDLANIKEEEEEKEDEKVEAEEKCGSEKDAMRDEKVVEARRTVDATSDQLERNDTAEVENVPSETTVFANQGREEVTLGDCTYEQPLFLDTVIKPCVPELKLDSFRDATWKMEDGNDSINVENLSEKESVGDGNVLCEAETTSASFDTTSAKTKETIDENSLSESRPDSDRFRGENATKGHDCSVDRRDSSNTEEEIARELIKNLTGDASILEETTDRNAATEATDSFDRNDNMPSEHATVSTATVDPIDVNTDIDTDIDIDVDIGIGIGIGIGIDGNIRDDESKVKGEGDNVAGTCSRLAGTIGETAFGCEQFSENQDQSELSKEPVIESNLRNKSLDAAVRIIQFRVREFMRRRRNSKKSDEERYYQRDSLDTSTVRKATSSLARQNIQLMKSEEGVAISNVRCCDEEKFRESKASEASTPKTKNEEWLSTAQAVTEAAENQRALEKHGSSISHGSMHTGEFHDSLPLPLPASEISKGRVSPTDATARALERVRDDAVKPLLTLKPDTSSFRHESPETCVLLAFDFPKNLKLIENASNWPGLGQSFVDLPSYIVRVERDFDGDKAKVDSSAGESFSYDVDDIREPLALDRTSETILIEEILTDEEEEKERLPSLSDNAVDEYASSTHFAFEHVDFDSEGNGNKSTRET